MSPKKKVVAVGHYNLHTVKNEPDSDLKSGMAAKKLDFGRLICI